MHGSLSPAEHAAFFDLIDQVERNDLHQLISDRLDTLEGHEPIPAFINDRVELLHQEILAEINEDTQEAKPSFSPLVRSLSATAAAILLFISLTYVLTDRLGDISVDDNIKAQQAILPASMKAVIQIGGVDYELSGGQGGVFFANDSVFYDDGTPIVGGLADENIAVLTPMGGHYHLTLSDGSKVWLNAGSRLSYSNRYGQHERRVRLMGEGYFEVLPRDGVPFIVESGEQEVRVLGTNFNINAYPDERTVRTTLNTGALKVKSTTGNIILEPNQQAVFNANENRIDKVAVDASTFSDWKEGIINLHGVSIQECMRMIARWYDLDVVFTTDMPQIQLGGKMSRGVNLHTFLTFLNQNFQLESELVNSQTLYIGTKND